MSGGGGGGVEEKCRKWKQVEGKCIDSSVDGDLLSVTQASPQESEVHCFEMMNAHVISEGGPLAHGWNFKSRY